MLGIEMSKKHLIHDLGHFFDILVLGAEALSAVDTGGYIMKHLDVGRREPVCGFLSIRLRAIAYEGSTRMEPFAQTRPQSLKPSPNQSRGADMPVKHDLSQDLGFTKEALAALKDKDPHLAALIEKYAEADQKVVEAEAHNALGVPDEVLLALKEKRLKIKDDIVNRLDSQPRS